MRQFYTLYDQKFLNLSHFSPLLFPKDSGNLKIWTFDFEKLGQKDIWTEWTNEKNPQKKLFSPAEILHPLWAKVFKSETTSFY